MQRLYEAECEQPAMSQTNNLAGLSENEILLFRNQLKVNFSNQHKFEKQRISSGYSKIGLLLLIIHKLFHPHICSI